MKDSLSLNKEEAKKIYEINLWLQAKKMEARKVHAGSPTLVSQKIQQIENMRDSLYRRVLTDSTRFNNYKRGKTHMVSNN